MPDGAPTFLETLAGQIQAGEEQFRRRQQQVTQIQLQDLLRQQRIREAQQALPTLSQAQELGKDLPEGTSLNIPIREGGTVRIGQPRPVQPTFLQTFGGVPTGFEVTGFSATGQPLIRRIKPPKEVSGAEITRLRKFFEMEFKGIRFTAGEKRGVTDKIRSFANSVITQREKPRRFPPEFFTLIDDVIESFGALTPGIIGRGERDLAIQLNDVRREALEHNTRIAPQAGRSLEELLGGLQRQQIVQQEQLEEENFVTRKDLMAFAKERGISEADAESQLREQGIAVR